MTDNTEEKNPLAEWRDKNLNTISDSFCAAKWYNASLHLGHGYTNSCHLPLPHPIDLEEIKQIHLLCIIHLIKKLQGK